MATSKDLIKLSENDAFIGSVMKQDLSMFAEMEPPEVLADIRECALVLDRNEQVRGVIGMRLGAALARVAKDELFRGFGYPTLKAFEEAELHGQGAEHPTIWVYKQITEAFPRLTTERCMAIGPKRLTAAATVANKLGYQPEQKEELLVEAEQSTSVVAFRKQVEKRLGGDSSGALQGASYPLFGSKEEVDDLKERLADGRAIEFAGSNRPIQMILAWESESSSVYPVERAKGDMTIHVKSRQETEF